MSKRLLDYDPQAKLGQYFYYDVETDIATITNEQDVSGILDVNRQEFNDAPARHGDGLGKKVASIPLGVYMDLRAKGIAQDPKAFKRWLNSSDNAAFRTAPGRV